MVDQVELLPCPFCDAKASMMRDDGALYKVKCSGAWCFAERACWRQTEHAALKDWNTRHADAEVTPEMIDAAMRAFGDTEIVGGPPSFTRRAVANAVRAALAHPNNTGEV